MKVTIKPDSPRFPVWVRVFGFGAAVEVEPAGELDGKQRLRVKLSALTVRQRQRCALHISDSTNLPVDRAARISPTVDADDVVVLQELFP